MKKKYENLILLFLIVFALYCSLILGMSWDESYHYDLGKNRLKYLLSLGKYEYISPFLFTSNSSYFSGFYDTLTAFISQTMPRKYEVQIHHLINLLFSFSTIVGVAKISKNLFNNKVSKIVFLISFLNPIFFGHMSINPIDTIIAFSNVWATYFIIRYLQTQHLEIKRKYYSTLIGIAIGFGVGTRVIFLATLLPIITLFFLDIFVIKIFKNKKFSITNFFKDFVKIFLIAYFMMIIFWPEVHPNIFVLPFKFIFSSLTDVTFGSFWALLDGEFYKTTNTPRLYLIINLFYKLPEYILLTYIIFIFLLFKEKKFFEKDFKLFKIKILYIIFIITFPIIIAMVVALKIHDGLRYFLFLIPYLSIIPGISIYYLIYNSKPLLNKFLTTLVFISFSHFLFIFFSLTPYQYIYLNKFSGDFSNSSERFENDYWGASIKELVKKIELNSEFQKDKTYKIAYCGINYDIGDYYLKKILNLKFIKTSKDDNYDYILMTNRQNGKNTDKQEEVKTCFQTYKGKDVIFVKKRGLILSTLREKI